MKEMELLIVTTEHGILLHCSRKSPNEHHASAIPNMENYGKDWNKTLSQHIHACKCPQGHRAK